MMNRVFAVLLLFNSWSLFSQEKLEPLQAPTAPAAGVLGIQPAAVLTPKTYDALELGLFSNIANSNGGFGLPTDFALEFSPYWAKDHGLSLEDYLFPARGDSSSFLKGIGKQFIRSSSLSIASTQNFVLGNDTASNGIGIGYRCSFFWGMKNDRKKIRAFRNSLRESQNIESKLIANAEMIATREGMTKEQFLMEIISVLEKKLLEVRPDQSDEWATALSKQIMETAKATLPDLDPNEPDEFLDTFYDLVEANLNSFQLFEEFKGYIRQREGFSLDVAYASFLNFPTNNFTYSYIPKQTFWITPGYRFAGDNLQITLSSVLRYEWYLLDYYKQFFPTKDLYEHNWDYGVAISAKGKGFTLKFECVGRNSSSMGVIGTSDEGMTIYENRSSTDLQYLGTLDFNISDLILLSYTLGNRFSPVVNPNNTLVSTLSINFAFGGPKSPPLE